MWTSTFTSYSLTWDLSADVTVNNVFPVKSSFLDIDAVYSIVVSAWLVAPVMENIADETVFWKLTFTFRPLMSVPTGNESAL